MGLAEVTMKHAEMGIKTSMLEVNALAEEWEGHFFDTLWLNNRYPKLKDIQSSDGDASTTGEPSQSVGVRTVLSLHDLGYL